MIEVNDKTIVRVRHGSENPYFLMARSTAQDRALAYESLGMLAYLLSKPDNWQVTVADLMREGCGRDKTIRILNSLLEMHYASHDKQEKNTETQQFAPLTWVIFETPYTEDQGTGFPREPYTENPLLHNTDSQSTDLEIQDSALRLEDQDLKISSPSENRVSNSLAQGPVLHNAVPVTDPLNLAPVPPPPSPDFAAAVEVLEIAISSKPAMYIAVSTVFGQPPREDMKSPFTWKIIRFLKGESTKSGKSTKWDEFKIDFVDVTPVMVMAFGYWYKHTPRFQSQKSPPPGGETLHDHIAEFTGSEYFDPCMQRGREQLIKLLGLETPVDPKSVPLPREQVEAALKAAKERMFHARTNE